MNNIKLFIGLLIAALVLTSAPVLAHVVIMSEQGGSKAVFHISPADDPVAGTQSTLFFDISDSQTTLKNATATLQISGPNSSQESKNTSISDGTVSATHTFASGGAYKLKLVITSTDPSAEVLEFNYEQTVRSVSQTTAAKSSQLPLFMLIGGVIVLIVIASAYTHKHISKNKK